jgi:tetratricopeptide (TPR) repeat protein
MILRLSSSAQRGALVFAAALVAAFLSYFSIRNARADHFAGLQKNLQALERATQLEPGDARNWYLLGRYWQFNLEDSDPQKAARAYKTAVSIDPHSTVSWLGLGSAYESAGDLPHAREAFLQAKKVNPLSAEAAWQYGNFLLRQGDLESAFTEMRRAVESDPKRGAEAFSRAFRAEPDVNRILNRAIPPNRDVYVDIIWDQITDGQTDIALQVWDRLVAIHPRLPLREVSPLIGALRNSKRITDARRVWEQAVVVAGMADLQGPPRSVLWDGGFESGVTGGGYSWLFPEDLRNVQVSIDAQERHSGEHSLRLTFDGKSIVNSMDICHYVPVSPSTSYHFSAWVKTKAVTTDQGVRFQLRSLGTHDTSVAMTPELHGSEPWTHIEIPWSSGKDVQEVQVCLVRFLSDQLENKIKGTTWVDDIALVPDSAEHPKP